MLLFALWACTGDDVGPPPADTDDPPVATCAPERTLVVTVSGAVGADANAHVGIFESSTWRMGDATPLTTLLSRDGEQFTLCLTTDPPVVRYYELAFWGAWVDLDGDARLDAATEAVCDRTGDTLAEELYFDVGRWRTGLYGTPGDPNVSIALDAPLNGDRCAL